MDQLRLDLRSYRPYLIAIAALFSAFIYFSFPALHEQTHHSTPSSSASSSSLSLADHARNSGHYRAPFSGQNHHLFNPGMTGVHVDEYSSHAKQISLSPTDSHVENLRIKWQMPPGDNAIGAVILLHSCFRSYKNWFTRPEEKRIVRMLLAKRLAVIAAQFVTGDDEEQQQQQQQQQCWETTFPASENAQVQHFVRLFRIWQSKEAHQTANLPLFAIAIHHAGDFVSILAEEIKLSGVFLEYSVGNKKSWHKIARLASSQHAIEKHKQKHLPHIWVLYTTTEANSFNRLIAHNALDEENIPYDAIAIEPRALSPSYLSSRIDGITLYASTKFYRKCRSLRLLSSHDKLIGRQSDMLFLKVLPLLDQEARTNLDFNARDVIDVLNELAASGDVTSTHFEIVADAFAQMVSADNR